MRSVPRNAASALVSLVRRARERRRLSTLYNPDPSNLNAAEHIAGALAWLERAQDVGTDRGVSYGVRFGSDFQESYPETTGYICRTFVEHAQAGGDPRLMDRAIEMGHWESDIQLPDGAVISGTVNRDPRPAIFNTGMVMLGWNALIRSCGDDRFRNSCDRAARWLVSMQEADGRWVRGNSAFVRPGSTLYNVKAAWALCEAGQLLERRQYVEAAVHNAEFCLSRQRRNGWFEDCCLTDPERPLLHTLAYAMQGLIGIGRLTGRRDFIAAARKTADAQLRIMGADGFLAGRQDASSISPVS